MDRLTGKRALITGGTTGIGLESARQFLAEGARVAITGTNPKNLEAAREALGPDVLIFPSDAASVPAQKNLAVSIHEAFGGLDILFLNAGVAPFKPVEQWDEESFDRALAINLKGPFFLVQALLPYFANPASVILTTSINAHIGMANSSIYAATKAALISLARTLSGELMPRGIRVNAISPGPIATPLYDKLGLSANDIQHMSEGLMAKLPAKRFGDPSEIARVAVLLASQEAAFAVGSEFILDGGLSL